MTNEMSPQIMLINDLLAEKDRLLREKDELIASKDRLWRELHQIVCEKDVEIARLSSERDALAKENSKIGERCRKLEEALTELLDREEEEDDNEDDVEEGGEYDTLNPELLDGNINLHGSNLDVTEYKQSSLDRTAITKDSPEGPNHATKSFKPIGSEFTFLPLIRLTEEGTVELGAIDKVASSVMRSIRSVIAEIRSRNQRGKRPMHPKLDWHATSCAWLWALEQTGSARWTIKSPRAFACYSCFNARRACILWLGDMKWMLLPLPPHVRDENATLEEPQYYIYNGLKPPNHFQECGGMLKPQRAKSTQGKKYETPALA